MANPFDERDEGPEADKRLTEKLERKAFREGAITRDTGALPEDEIIEVPFSDPEDDDDLEDDDGLTRQERKSRRFKENRRAREEAERRAEELSRENERLRQQTMAPAPTYYQQPQQPQVDPLQQEIDSVYHQRKLAFDAVSAKGAALTKEEHEKYLEESRKLEDRYTQLVAQKTMRDIQQQQGGRSRQEALEFRYPDVMENPSAKAHALAAYATWRAENPQARESWSDYDRFMEEARRKAKIGRYAGDPTDSERSAHTDGSRRTAAAAGAPPSSQSRSIRLTPAMKQMADAAYPHIRDERERLKKWANGPGRRYLEAEKRAGRG